ncbi:alpha beta hydrolase [Nannochloropsis oceanica]
MQRTTRSGLAYLIKTLPSSSSASLSATCTILFCHANGFNKEVFLPVWEELEKRWRAYPGTCPPPLTLVSLDFTGHGDSRGVSGPECYDWRKGAGRDVLEMLQELGQTGTTPCLGVGHSLGATALTMVELTHPGLFFAGLVLIEPVLVPPGGEGSMSEALSERALKRRASWPYKTAAREYLASRQMFKRWDPRAFNAYIDGGLEEIDHKGDPHQLPTGTIQRMVRLKCKPESEAGYYRGAGASVWPELPKLGVSRPVTFIAGEHSEHMSAILITEKHSTGADAARMLVGLMGPQTRLVLVPKGSHFVVMEDVALVAGMVWERVLETMREKNSSGSTAGEEGAGARSSL